MKEGEGATWLEGYTQTICTGDPSCEGEVAWCKEEERKNETCPSIDRSQDDMGVELSRCSPALGGSKKKEWTNGIPGQCVKNSETQDGNSYHCMDRTDENPFRAAVRSKTKLEIAIGNLQSCTDRRGLPGLDCSKEGERSNCIAMQWWCSHESYSEPCPVLGKYIRTNNPRVCQEYSFWHDKPCYDDLYIRCRTGYSGQCVEKQYWGVEGAKDRDGRNLSCKDGSDLFRPVVEAEEPVRRPYMWKTKPGMEDDYSSDHFVKEGTTTLMMAPTTKETCEANDGFMCRVRPGDVTSLI